MNRRNEPNILYIMGPGRSGSTILEILLANNKGAIGAGEITPLFEFGLLGRINCSCGQPMERCPQWAPVYARFRGSEANWREYQQVIQAVDWHKGFMHTLLARHPAARMTEYRRLNELILAGLAERTDCRWVIDSSKYAGRAVALSSLFPGRVWVISLTRSPEGLIHSFSKPGQEQGAKSMPRLIPYYLYVLLSVRLAAARLKVRVLQLRYEELIADPAGTLQRIQNWCGIDLSEAVGKIRQNTPLAPGHIIVGNRLRHQGEVRLNGEARPAVPRGASQHLAAASMHAGRRLLGF